MQPLPSTSTTEAYTFRHAAVPSKQDVERVRAELKAAGAVAYDLWLPETRFLPRIIHADEHVMGTVYGRYKGGRGVLVATDQRVIFLDKKPGWMRCNELTFAVIGGVTRTRIGPVGTVVLHTRLGDYSLRTFNQKNAENFVDYIETQCLKPDSPAPSWGVL